MGKMSLSGYMKGGYEDFHALGRRKNKPNSKPIKLVLSAVEWSQYYLAPRFSGGWKHNLKKQSQFAPARKNAKSYLKGDYENISRPGSRENKPKQSQSSLSLQLCSGQALSKVEWSQPPGIGARQAGTRSLGFGGGACKLQGPGRLFGRMGTCICSRGRLFRYSVRRGAAAFCSENMQKTDVLACQVRFIGVASIVIVWN